jgi:hypothetical protein
LLLRSYDGNFPKIQENVKEERITNMENFSQSLNRLGNFENNKKIHKCDGDILVPSHLRKLEKLEHTKFSKTGMHFRSVSKSLAKEQ